MEQISGADPVEMEESSDSSVERIPTTDNVTRQDPGDTDD
jgi:hypothetical protein